MIYDFIVLAHRERERERDLVTIAFVVLWTITILKLEVKVCLQNPFAAVNTHSKLKPSCIGLL